MVAKRTVHPTNPNNQNPNNLDRRVCSKEYGLHKLFAYDPDHADCLLQKKSPMKYLVFVFWGVSVEEVVGFERDHRVREVEQVGSACQPNFVHYCALAASPLLSCNVYAPVFRTKNYAYCIYTYTGCPQKCCWSHGALAHLLAVSTQCYRTWKRLSLNFFVLVVSYQE